MKSSTKEPEREMAQQESGAKLFLIVALTVTTVLLAFYRQAAYLATLPVPSYAVNLNAYRVAHPRA